MLHVEMQCCMLRCTEVYSLLDVILNIEHSYKVIRVLLDPD